MTVYPHINVIRLAILLLSAPLFVSAQDDGSYPSCIGLELATNFFFSGDVTDTAGCQVACSTLFGDDGMFFDSVTAADGRILAYCECSAGGGRLCQDEVSSGGAAEMATTTALPPPTTEEEETTMMVETTEEPTSAPPSPTPAPTSSAATMGISIMLLCSLGLSAMTTTLDN